MIENKKSPDGNRSSDKNISSTLYPKSVRKYRADRVAELLVFVAGALLTLLLILSGLNRNLSIKLSDTHAKLEIAREENATLWDSVRALQVENKELVDTNEALVILLNNEEPVEREICSTSTFKSWMDYRAITDSSSKQWQLQQSATTDPYYGMRLYGEYVMVAMGPQYGPVGTKYLIQFQDRSVIKAIVSDIKHQGCTSADSSMIEFLIDKEVLPGFIKTSGNFNSVFNGSIILIREVE